jgi:hypothetical protein
VTGVDIFCRFTHVRFSNRTAIWRGYMSLFSERTVWIRENYIKEEESCNPFDVTWTCEESQTITGTKVSNESTRKEIGNHKRARLLLTPAERHPVRVLSSCVQVPSAELEGDWIQSEQCRVWHLKNVLEQVTGRCYFVENLTGPSSPSTDPNSPTILQKFATCRA